MTHHQANCWPTQQQSLLLKAALLPSEEALNAWEAYCQQVDIHKIDHASLNLLPLVYHNLRDIASFSPALQFCKKNYQQAWAINQTIFYHSMQELHLFSKAQIHFCLLKGAAMLACCYKKAGIRPLGDIDILVPQQQARAAIKLLITLGWQPEIEHDQKITEHFLNTHHALFLTHPDGRKFDLHWHLSPNHISDQALRKLAYNTRSAPLIQTSAHLLSVEDQLFHILTHGIRYSPVPLIRWVADASTLIKHHPEFNWHYFLSQAKKARLFLLAQQALLFLNQHAFAHLPSETLSELKSYRPSRFEINHLRFITRNHNRWLMPIKIVWHLHLRNRRPRNKTTALLTWHRSLMASWKITRVWKLPLVASKKFFSHLMRELRKN